MTLFQSMPMVRPKPRQVGQAPSGDSYENRPMLALPRGRAHSGQPRPRRSTWPLSSATGAGSCAPLAPFFLLALLFALALTRLLAALATAAARFTSAATPALNPWRSEERRV